MDTEKLINLVFSEKALRTLVPQMFVCCRCQYYHFYDRANSPDRQFARILLQCARSLRLMKLTQFLKILHVTILLGFRGWPWDTGNVPVCCGNTRHRSKEYVAPNKPLHSNTGGHEDWLKLAWIEGSLGPHLRLCFPLQTESAYPFVTQSITIV
jgi:hypothetical protein